MFGISFIELLVIGVVGLLIFGGTMPEVIKSLAIFLRKAQRLFHEIKYDIEDDIGGISPKPSGKSIEERENG